MERISIEVFKTNVTNPDDSERIIKELHYLFPGSEINFDLDDCDKILRVEGEDFISAQIIEKLSEYGYLCEILQ